MDNISYVKGSREDVVKRFNQINTVTLRCPASDSGIKVLKTTMFSLLSFYSDNEGKFNEVPCIDAFNAFMTTLTLCKQSSINTEILYVVIGCVQSFKNLKKLTIEFSDDEKVMDAYVKVQKKNNTDDDKIKILKYIYDVNVLEFNLSDMFSQEIIDAFNKCMMLNGLISNSYLKREFYVNFDYDGYVAFMDMFLGNNGIKFESLDSNIMDYFRLFPTFIADQKPSIIVVTNYKDL